MSNARNIASIAGEDVLNASNEIVPVYACRAWVNFNGTGTVAIRESGNVSSITDLGTGQYEITFTTAMPDANYAVIGLTQYQNNAGQVLMEGPSDAGINSFKVYTKTNSNGVYDAVFNSVAVFR
jgi:hypothetical protein